MEYQIVNGNYGYVRTLLACRFKLGFKKQVELESSVFIPDSKEFASIVIGGLYTIRKQVLFIASNFGDKVAIYILYTVKNTHHSRFIGYVKHGEKFKAHIDRLEEDNEFLISITDGDNVYSIKIKTNATFKNYCFILPPEYKDGEFFNVKVKYTIE